MSRSLRAQIDACVALGDVGHKLVLCGLFALVFVATHPPRRGVRSVGLCPRLPFDVSEPCEFDSEPRTKYSNETAIRFCFVGSSVCRCASMRKRDACLRLSMANGSLEDRVLLQADIFSAEFLPACEVEFPDPDAILLWARIGGTLLKRYTFVCGRA